MRNLLIAGITIAFAFALLGCTKGMDEAKYKKVIDKYYALNFDAVKAKKDFDSDKAWAEAVKEGGFKDKKAFDEAVAKWDATKASEILKKAGDDYSKKLTKWSEDEAKKAAGGGGDKPAEKTE